MTQEQTAAQALSEREKFEAWVTLRPDLANNPYNRMLVWEAWQAAATQAPAVAPAEAIKLKVGGKYNWKGQTERLVYLGRNWSGNGYWHQFALVKNPGVVWSEVTDHELNNFEETAPSGAEQPEAPTGYMLIERPGLYAPRGEVKDGFIDDILTIAHQLSDAIKKNDVARMKSNSAALNNLILRGALDAFDSARPPAPAEQQAGEATKVPDYALVCIQEYGDARADDDGTSALRLKEAIKELRRWATSLTPSEAAKVPDIKGNTK